VLLKACFVSTTGAYRVLKAIERIKKDGTRELLPGTRNPPIASRAL
jgi:hypothetical protein